MTEINNTKALFRGRCGQLREAIANIDVDVRNLVHDAVFAYPDHLPGGGSDMAASIMLAHRHCEDARMRLGAAIQAMEGVTLTR